MLGVVLLVLIDAAAPPPPPTPTSSATAPASIGRQHLCPETMYSVSALQTGTEGETLMNFTITKDGRVTDVSVKTSSGNADLDAAGVTCARDWLYRPARQDGAPVDSPWRALVRWRITVTGPYLPMARASLACLKADSVGWEEFKKASLHTVTRIHFAGGVMDEVTVVGSSGDADLDSRVAACYRSVPPALVASVPDGDKMFVAMMSSGWF